MRAFYWYFTVLKITNISWNDIILLYLCEPFMFTISKSTFVTLIRCVFIYRIAIVLGQKRYLFVQCVCGCISYYHHKNQLMCWNKKNLLDLLTNKRKWLDSFWYITHLSSISDLTESVLKYSYMCVVEFIYWLKVYTAERHICLFGGLDDLCLTWNSRV